MPETIAGRRVRIFSFQQPGHADFRLLRYASLPPPEAAAFHEGIPSICHAAADGRLSRLIAASDCVERQRLREASMRR